MGHVSRLVYAHCAPLLFTLLLPAALRAQDRGDFDVGLGLYERGLWEEAIQHFDRHLKADKDGKKATEAWYRLGTCHKKLGHDLASMGAFEQVLKRDPEFRYRNETRYQLGLLLQAAGKQAKACEQFEALLEEAPDHHYLAAPASYALGECRKDLGKKAKALEAFQQAYELDPKGDHALASLYQGGFLLLDAGQAAAAAGAFGRAADTFPADALASECRYLQGRALAKAGRDEQAEAAFRKVAGRPGKRQAEARLALARSLRKQDRGADAQAVLRTFLRENEKSPALGRALLELAQLEDEAGGSKQARKHLERATSVSTAKADRLLILEELAWQLLDDGQAMAAARRFGEALSLGPDPAHAALLHHGRGQAWSDSKKYEEALADHETAEKLSADPGLRGDALYARLYILHLLKRYEESLALAQAFARTCPEHPSAMRAKFAGAENLFALHRYGEARKQYAGVTGEQDPPARHKAAWCLYLDGHKKEAANAFAILSGDAALSADLREDALAMEALTRLETGEVDLALTRADLYRARYPQGRWLARCDIVASRALRKKGKLKAAATRLSHAISLSEGAAVEAQELDMAGLLQQQGDFEKARHYYARHTKAAGAPGFRALEGLAWCAFELGDLDECRARGSEALARPEARKLGASLRNLLCSVELNDKQWAAAERMAGDFLRIHPEDRREGEMRFSLALAMARGGKVQEAEKALTELIEDHGGARVDRVWYELAWTRRKLGKEEPALAAFRKVAETSKDPALRGESRLHLAESLLASGKTGQAEKELARVEGAYRSRALYRLGFSQFEHKQYRKALSSFAALEKVRERDRYTAASPFLQAECHYELGELEAAAGLYRSYLAAKVPDGKSDGLQEHAGRARYHLGHCELEQGQYVRSAELLRTWIGGTGGKASKVDQAQAWLWLGRAEKGRSRAEASEKAFQRATRLSEGVIAAEAWYRIGELRRDQSKLEGAIEAFLRLSILFDESTWVSKALLEAGLCFEGLKKPAKAQKLYRELLDRYPGTESAKAAKPRLETKRKL